MKTRDELLAMADDYIDNAKHNEEHGNVNAALVIAQATLAQACVMLAKELREGENAERTVAAINGVANAVDRASRGGGV